MTKDKDMKSEPVKVSAYERLSPKHKLFFKNYIACSFNLADAYKLTYPKASDRSVDANAYKMGKNGLIKEALKEYADSITEEYIIASLDKEAKTADKSSSRIQALTVLSDIKNMRKNQKLESHTHLHTTRIEDIREKLAEKQHSRTIPST